MKKSVFQLLCFCVLGSQLFAQNLEWASATGGNEGDFSAAIHVDEAQNIYHLGVFKSTIDADPGPDEWVLNAVGNNDIVLQKFNPNGSLIWALQFGSVDDERGIDLTTDPFGNIWITGIFRNTLDADPGSGMVNLIGNATWDFFLIKLDQDGNYLWSGAFGGSQFDFSRALEADAAGNILVAGSFQSDVDFDPGSEEHIVASTGYSNIFVFQLNNEGAFNWVKTVQGPSSNNCFDIALDNDGNIYLTGDFVGTSDFDPGSTDVSISSNGWEDIYLLKLNPDGEFVWAYNFGNSIGDSGRALATDNNGNIYLAGYFTASADFDPGSEETLLISEGEDDIFVCKFTPEGALSWAKQIGGSMDDRAYALTVGPNFEVYLGGYFQGTVDFDPGPEEWIIESDPGNDLDGFLVELAPDGSFSWAHTFGSIAPDEIVDLTTDQSGFLMASGNFGNTIDVDPGMGTFSLESNGGLDMFLQRIDPIISSTKQLKIAPFQIEAFPNPTTGPLTLQWDAAAQFTSIELYNSTGQLEEIFEIKGTDQSTIQLPDHIGWYLLKFVHPKGDFQTLKVIKN